MIEIKWLILIFVISLVSKVTCSIRAHSLHYNYKWYKKNSLSGILGSLGMWFIGIYLTGYYIVIPFFNWFKTL